MKPLPENSILNKDKNHYDYIDTYQSHFVEKNNTIGPTEVGKAFFSSSPKWVEALFVLRNKIVSLFGLKTSGEDTDRKKQLDNFKCEVGEQLGLFKVFNKTKDEVVLGEDDKHLNFRVSLLLGQLIDGTDKKALAITTTVQFNNLFGKLYFLPVKIFHKLIVPEMLKGIIKELER